MILSDHQLRAIVFGAKGTPGDDHWERPRDVSVGLEGVGDRPETLNIGPTPDIEGVPIGLDGLSFCFGPSSRYSADVIRVFQSFAFTFPVGATRSCTLLASDFGLLAASVI